MGELKDWFERAAGKPRKIQRVYPGQVIYMTVATNKNPETGEIKNVKRAYDIDAVYPGFIRVHWHNAGRKHTDTFTLGDLVINGYEPVQQFMEV